jgi:hypothetical protein
VAHERAAWFRRGFRFRAGIEGRISVLRRRFGLDRCRDHGEAGLGRWVGWGIVTASLITLQAQGTPILSREPQRPGGIVAVQQVQLGSIHLPIVPPIQVINLAGERLGRQRV